jgi:hypothetical protein
MQCLGSVYLSIAKTSLYEFSHGGRDVVKYVIIRRVYVDTSMLPVVVIQPTVLKPLKTSLLSLCQRSRPAAPHPLLA